jgi:hypothetical protein
MRVKTIYAGCTLKVWTKSRADLPYQNKKQNSYKYRTRCILKVWTKSRPGLPYQNKTKFLQIQDKVYIKSLDKIKRGFTIPKQKNKIPTNTGQGVNQMLGQIHELAHHTKTRNKRSYKDTPKCNYDVLRV